MHFLLKKYHIDMIMLMYHNVSPHFENKRKSPYVLNHLDFYHQMDYLYCQGFTTQSLSNFLHISEQEDFFNSIILTFDDGHFSNYSIAYPVLQKYHFKGVFFITTGWVGEKDRLSWEQIKEMSSGNMGIGSHTVTHPYLTTLSKKSIRYELEYSKMTLEDKLGKSVDFLAIPGGLYSKLVKQIAKEVGYLGVCTSYIGINDINSDLYSLKRINIGGNITLPEFALLLQGNSILKKKGIQSMLNILKNCLGINNYSMLKKYFQESIWK